MRFLLTIHHYLDKNLGAPGVTLTLGKEYRDQGHQVEYFSFDNLPKYLPEIFKMILFPYFVAAYIYRRSEKHSFNIVTASTGDSWFWAKFLRKLDTNPPLLATQSHGLEHMLHLQNLEDAKHGRLKLSWKYPLYHGGWRLWEVASSLRLADVCFLLNNSDAEYAVQHLGVDQAKVHIIPNGIPDYLLGIKHICNRCAADEQIRIAYIGNYIPTKGVNYLKDALNVVLSKYENVSLTLLGTCCPSEKVLRDFDPRLHDRIQVIPRYEHRDLPLLLKGHHIKVLATLSEGFGLAVIEAMACGLAPIVTRTPGPKTIITHGDDGFLIPTRDSDAIEAAIRQLLDNPSLLEEIRRNAYETAQQYSWTKISRKRLDIYKAATSSTEVSLKPAF